MKFMNAELIAIRDNLTCGHCGSVFQGTDSQAYGVKYQHRNVYCSVVCRGAAISKKFSTPVPNRGPCGTCGEQFFSRTAKQYCGLKCYTGSKQFTEMLAASREKSRAPESVAKRAALQRKGVDVKCLHCGEEFYQKRVVGGRLRKPKTFCGRACYRAYMALRFDRWIADPKGLALPQCYDEFLDREHLDCILEGCGWSGTHLSAHINLSHGIVANDFKRAAGFNLSTGLVGRAVSKAMSERAIQGVARAGPQQRAALAIAHGNKNATRYASKEGVEHHAKAHALQREYLGPMRCCAGCGGVYQQSTPMGRSKYCSVPCRTASYAREREERPKKARERAVDGTFR